MAVVVPATIVAPISIGGFKLQFLSRPLKFFWIYLIFGGLVNVIATAMAYNNVNNLPLLHAYTLIEFIILSACYQNIITYPWFRLTTRIVVGAFAILCIINAGFIQSIYVYNSLTRSVETILILIYCLYYFRQSLDNATEITPDSKVLLFLNSGIIVYFGGSLFLFISSNLITTNLRLNTIFWLIHATLALFMYILFTLGFLHVKKLR
jgi:hypothetical protein